jgi:hypothetical protein
MPFSRVPDVPGAGSVPPPTTRVVALTPAIVVHYLLSHDSTHVRIPLSTAVVGCTFRTGAAFAASILFWCMASAQYTGVSVCALSRSAFWINVGAAHSWPGSALHAGHFVASARRYSVTTSSLQSRRIVAPLNPRFG